MFSESLVTVDKLKLNHMVGPANGPPLLLLHGVLRRWQTFHPLLPHLVARYQLHGLDLPGHGASDRWSGHYRVSEYVQLASAFVREELPEPLLIYGHSLGAMVAAGIASELGEHVRAIVLEDPPLDTMGPQIRQSSLHGYFSSIQRWAGSRLPRDQVARELAELMIVDPVTGIHQRFGDQRDAAQLRFMASCLAQLDPRVLDPIAEARWLEGFDWRKVFAELDCPVLLLQADTTVAGMLTDDDANDAARLARYLTLVKLRGCGHGMHWARTQEVVNLTVAFLESL